MADVLSLDGAVAVVTGAGRGLGRAHALALAARGASVVVNDIGAALDGTSDGGLQPGDAVVAEILAGGGVAIADNNSVATSAGGSAVIAAALDQFGRIDIVVNNAGFIRDKAFHKMTDEQLGDVLDVHLKGAVHVTRPAWSHMRDQGYGRVINTSSNAGLLGNFGQANYGAAKMGIVGLTRTLAIEGERYGIKVNAIAPIARTRMTDEVLGDLADLADPEGVSEVVALLAHPECPVSGEVLSVGVGAIARFVIGRTSGWDSGADFSAEDVLDNIGRIVDVAQIDILGSAMEELELLKAKHLHPS
jgi:NAD(P)-dependent dehydrogenase (short-subunit alcohol dehydrogenase family)